MYFFEVPPVPPVPQFSQVPMFWELLIFSTIATVTPGPNNVLTFIYALRFDLKTVLLFRLGIVIAAPVMNALVALGLMPFFETYPIVLTVMGYISVIFIIYIAYNIITSNPDIKSKDNTMMAMGVVASALFQVVNPKIWSMAIAVSSLYTIPDDPIVPQATAIYMVFLFTNIVTAIPWILGGFYFRTFFETPSRMRVFNWVMGIALIAMAVYSFTIVQ